MTSWLANGLTTLVRALFMAGLFIFSASSSSAQVERQRVAIEYIVPTNPQHEPIFTLLKEHQALERVRGVLSPVRWPRTLRLELRGCNGESNAWYEDAVVTVCYEYLDDIWRGANSAQRPPTIAREDAFVGPFMDVLLHEAGHALFDLLRIPVLGREEDAADQLAGYYMLQFPRDVKRKLILGSAYAYASELKVRRARDLHRPRLEVGRHITYADEHGTPAQRLYNLLCLAYGSDKELFAAVVQQGYLPESRAGICEGEYQQVEFAYRTLIEPNIDSRR